MNSRSWEGVMIMLMRTFDQYQSGIKYELILSYSLDVMRSSNLYCKTLT